MRNSEKKKKQTFLKKNITQFKSTFRKRQRTLHSSYYRVSSVAELLSFPFRRNLFLINQRKSPSIQGPHTIPQIHAKYFLFSNSSKIGFCGGISKLLLSKKSIYDKLKRRPCNSRTMEFSYIILLELNVKKSLQISEKYSENSFVLGET